MTSGKDREKEHFNKMIPKKKNHETIYSLFLDRSYQKDFSEKSCNNAKKEKAFVYS